MSEKPINGASITIDMLRNMPEQFQAGSPEGEPVPIREIEDTQLLELTIALKARVLQAQTAVQQAVEFHSNNLRFLAVVQYEAERRAKTIRIAKEI
jgi:hypothetical protein